MPTLTFKVSEDEARKLRAQARKARVTLSEYLRRRVRGDSKPLQGVSYQRCPLTGAKIFAPAPDYLPLTTDSVREMLADFP